MEEIEPLLFTPMPKVQEALIAFLIRLTYENGYPHMMVMLSPSGVQASHVRSGAVDLAVVAGLLACEVDDLVHLDHIRGPDALRCKTRWLAGHQLANHQVRPASGRVCPECVTEDGYLSVFWTLRHAIACPRHRKLPVEVCSSCNRDVRWRRPGLLVCECGDQLDRTKGSRSAAKAHCTVLELVHEKLLGRTIATPALISAGYPLDALSSVRPAGLLVLADRLADLPRSDGRAAEQSREQRGLEMLHRVLTDWPVGFHQFLRSMLRSRTVRSFFPIGDGKGSLFNRLFRGPEPDSFPFLEAEFLQFGLESCDWGRPIVRTHATPLASLDDIAKTAGVKVPAARRLIEDGAIEARPAGRSTEDIYCCDLQAVSRRRPRWGKWYVAGYVADVLKLPNDVLSGWAKTNGAYALGGKFHERDLYRLVQRLRDLMSGLNEVSASAGETLGRVFAKGKCTLDQKVAVFEALVAGTLVPLGRSGDLPRSIVLAETEFEAVIRSRPAPAPQPDPRELGVQEAAEVLGVDPASIFGLLDTGYLQVRAQRPPVQGGCRVDGLSILAFAERFVAARVVSRQRSVVKAARASRLEVPRRSSKKLRVFIPTTVKGLRLPTDYVERLERLCAQLNVEGEG